MIIVGAFLGYEIYLFNISSVVNILNYYKFGLFNVLMWNIVVVSTLGVNFYRRFLGNYLVKVIDQG